MTDSVQSLDSVIGRSHGNFEMYIHVILDLKQLNLLSIHTLYVFLWMARLSLPVPVKKVPNVESMSLK